MNFISKSVFYAVVTVLLFAVAMPFAGSKVFAGNSNYSKVKASHILVPTRTEADALKMRLDKGEDFESLAKKYSKCPSSAQGGDLGYFGKGQMVKEFETAAFALPVGQASEPVKTQFGWHLIKVYDKK